MDRRQHLYLWLATLFVAAMYFGDVRLRTPYDPIIVLLAFELCAMIVAWAVYQLSMRDELLPRFSRAAMPALPRPEVAEDSAPVPPDNQLRGYGSRRAARRALSRPGRIRRPPGA